MWNKKRKRINKLLEEVENMSDEELLRRERELYFSSGIRIVAGLGVLFAGLVVFSLMVPYL